VLFYSVVILFDSILKYYTVVLINLSCPRLEILLCQLYIRWFFFNI